MQTGFDPMARIAKHGAVIDPIAAADAIGLDMVVLKISLAQYAIAADIFDAWYKDAFAAWDAVCATGAPIGLPLSVFGEFFAATCDHKLAISSKTSA